MHQAIKNIVRTIKALYEGSQMEERTFKEKPKPTILTVSQTPQVTPNHVVIKTKIVRKKYWDPLAN